MSNSTEVQDVVEEFLKTLDWSDGVSDFNKAKFVAILKAFYRFLIKL